MHIESGQYNMKGRQTSSGTPSARKSANEWIGGKVEPEQVTLLSSSLRNLRNYNAFRNLGNQVLYAKKYKPDKIFAAWHRVAEENFFAGSVELRRHVSSYTKLQTFKRSCKFIRVKLHITV